MKKITVNKVKKSSILEYLKGLRKLLKRSIIIVNPFILELINLSDF